MLPATILDGGYDVLQLLAAAHLLRHDELAELAAQVAALLPASFPPPSCQARLSALRRHKGRWGHGRKNRGTMRFG